MVSQGRDAGLWTCALKHYSNGMRLYFIAGLMGCHLKESMNHLDGDK